MDRSITFGNAEMFSSNEAQCAARGIQPRRRRKGPVKPPPDRPQPLPDQQTWPTELAHPVRERA